MFLPLSETTLNPVEWDADCISFQTAETAQSNPLLGPSHAFSANILDLQLSKLHLHDGQKCSSLRRNLVMKELG